MLCWPVLLLVVPWSSSSSSEESEVSSELSLSSSSSSLLAVRVVCKTDNILASSAVTSSFPRVACDKKEVGYTVDRYLLSSSAHIFQNAQVTPNRTKTGRQPHFLAEFLMTSHIVWSVFVAIISSIP